MGKWDVSGEVRGDEPSLRGPDFRHRAHKCLRDNTLEIALVLTLVGMALCWVVALSASLHSKPPVMLVFGEASAGVGETLPLRVIGASANGRRQQHVEGEIWVNGKPVAALHDDSANLPLPNAMGTVTALIHGHIGAALADVEIKARVFHSPPARALPSWEPWRQTLLHPSAIALKGPAYYSLAGHVSSSLDGKLLAYNNGQIKVHKVGGNAYQVKTEAGDVLALDRSGLLVRAPTHVKPGGTLEVRLTASTTGRVFVDLLVAGRIRAIAQADLFTKGQRLRLTVPENAPEDGLFVVFVSGTPWARAQGVLALGRVTSSGSAGERDWLVEMARRAGAKKDPLVAALAAGTIPVDEDVTRAVLGRLRFSQLRPSSLTSPRLQRQRDTKRRGEAAAKWRQPFRWSCGFFVCLVLFSVWRRSTADLHRAQLDADDVATQKHPRTTNALAAALALLACGALVGVLDWILGFVAAGGMVP